MVTIYTKDYCPFCSQAKLLLKNLNIDFQEKDITDDMDTFQKIFQISKMRTVPQIFVWDHCLGGYSDIDALNQKWELIETIQELQK